MPAAHKTYGKITKRHRNQTRQQRGDTEKWYRFRDNVLANPRDYGFPEDFVFCADCLRIGRIEPTVDFHHKIRISVRPDLKFDPNNIMGLCKSCHAKRTARGE